MSQSLSNAPQPPSSFCIASSHRLPAGDRPRGARGPRPRRGTRTRRASREDLGGVVGVGVTLVGVLEVPAAPGASARAGLRPVARLLHFAIEQPARGPAQRRIVGGRRPRRPAPAMRAPCPRPARSKAGRAASPRPRSRASRAPAPGRSGAGRRGVAEAAESDDGVDDRREDRAEAVALDQALVDPLFADASRALFRNGVMLGGFEPTSASVDRREKDAPVRLAQRARRRARLRHELGVQLGDRGVVAAPGRTACEAQMTESGTTIPRDHDDIL